MFLSLFGKKPLTKEIEKMDSVLLTVFLLLTVIFLTFATLPLWMPKLVEWYEKREKHS